MANTAMIMNWMVVMAFVVVCVCRCRKDFLAGERKIFISDFVFVFHSAAAANVVLQPVKPR